MAASIIDLYLQEISDTRTGHWLSVGATALIVYDWLICMDVEIRFIWKARLSTGKILYFIHRYPLIVIGVISVYFDTAQNIPISRCKVWIPFEYCFDIFVVVFVQVTLLLRVYALYEKNRPIMIFLCLLLLMCLTTTLVLFGLIVRRFWYHEPVAPIAGCLPDCLNCLKWIPMLHLPLLIYDTVLVAFTLAKCFRFFKQDQLKLPTLHIVFRDGLIYYVVTFTIILFNVLFLSFTPIAMATWFLPWMRTIIGIMGTRLLLNLRGEIEERRDDTRFFLHSGGFGDAPEMIHLDSIVTPPSPAADPSQPDDIAVMRHRIARHWNLAAEDIPQRISPSSLSISVPLYEPGHVPMESSSGSDVVGHLHP